MEKQIRCSRKRPGLVNFVARGPALALRLAPLLLLTLAGCGSAPGGGEVTGTRAAKNLQSGLCPASIIDARGRNAAGEYRYGKALDAGSLAQLRQREVENCGRAASSGDSAALSTIAAYYRDTGRTDALIPVLEGYVASGSDRSALLNSATFLYRAYSTGKQGVARDDARAFRYLGVAVNNGASDLEMTYAQALMDRGLYDDALRNFQRMAGSSNSETRCEAQLSLAQLYFGASARHENWNIGYYYWRQGLDLAHGPDWGSCVKDNFVYGDRYSHESRRKNFVEQRIAMMSPAQRQVIDEARRTPGRGYNFVAQLSFQRPAGAPAPGASAPAPVAYRGGAWPAWQPLSGALCYLYPARRPGDWSEVFATNADAIWSVDSRNGATSAQGSAVAISPTELATNCHLIENPGNITLRKIGRSLPAKLTAADREGDRCLLSVDTRLPAFVRDARSYESLKVGEDVAAIGNPKGLETSLSRGIVAQKRKRDSLQLIQTDAAISSGSSGGGLFDRSGNLVGITTFTIASGQSLNFAIAIDEFCR